LLLGAERELVLISGIISAIFVMSLGRFVFAVLGMLFWAVSLVTLQRSAKADPQLSRVYLRHIRYRGYYAAQARATARTPIIREQMPC
jgi:type IV secretion system protein VirB3